MPRDRYYNDCMKSNQFKRSSLLKYSVVITIITEKKKVESIFGFEKSPRNCHSSVANKRKIEKRKLPKRKFSI